MNLDDLRRIALDRLGLPEAEPGARKYEVVATVLGSREPDDAETDALAQALADRLLAAAVVRADGGRPNGLSDATIDSSDDADCEDFEGNTGNAFIAGKRCYRIVAQASARRD